MDYSGVSIPWKARKVLRYVRLYGLRRTLAKVRAYRHMQKRYTQLPDRATGTRGSGNVGLIGCGQFAHSTVAYFLKRNYGSVIRACMDTDIDRAASLFESYRLSYYTDDADELLDDPQVNLVFIASNHASHAEYAIRALRKGKAVHIEKPHVVTVDQLERLCHTMEETHGRVALGFNRPESRFGRLIHRHLDSQSGPAVMNWFIAGHRIDPDHWYFKPEEGGRVLGNLCHWTDFVFRLVRPADRFPIVVTPVRAEKSDTDVAVTYRFGDGTIAVLSFSAKGHTFEGVRERFAAHKGDVLIAMDDFKTLVVDRVARKTRYYSWNRDHGHERRVRASYEMALGADTGASVSYVWETGQLFLRTREALQGQRALPVHPFDNRVT